MKPRDDAWPSPGTTPEARPPAPPPAVPAAGLPGREEDPWATAGHYPDDPEITEHQPDNPPSGICDLLHFSEPYKHARHYTGFANSSGFLKSRLAKHDAGRGARLLQVVQAVGITWTLARTWPGDRKRERQLKAQGGASRRCPECGVTPRTSPAEPKDLTSMKQPPRRDASPPPGTRPPEYVVEAWVSKQLRDRIQRTGAAPAEAGRSGDRQPREPDGPRLADQEAEP